MNEKLPPLHIGEDGEPEPTFWAGEKDETETIDDRKDERLSPNREELARLALEMRVPSATAKLPPTQGSEIYHG